MRLPGLWCRIHGRYRRAAAAAFARRPHSMANREPLISFTFDDFPRSALLVGGEILEAAGACGTYYTSLGLMAQMAPTGEIFHREDLVATLQRGHELGCHTFAHCDAAETSPQVFEESIEKNAEALQAVAPGATFKTLSYPIGTPTPATKKRCARHFPACREGGQAFNIGTIDLNRLQAFFIEQSRDTPEAIDRIIDENARAGGWLIFGTHDVSDSPTRYGCRPQLFEQIVKRSAQAGRILPVAEALAVIGVTAAHS